MHAPSVMIQTVNFFFTLCGPTIVNRPSLILIRRHSNDTFNLCSKEDSTHQHVHTTADTVISSHFISFVSHIVDKRELENEQVFSGM